MERTSDPAELNRLHLEAQSALLISLIEQTERGNHSNAKSLATAYALVKGTLKGSASAD